MVPAYRPKEKAILVHLHLGASHQHDEWQEFFDLVTSAGVEPVAEVHGHRDSPDSKFFVGTGKVEELKKIIADTQADVIIFNHELSPAQARNLETEVKARILDRTGLILDIFAQRARTFEGKLQVELAQLEFMSTRLVRGWTHLERQKGGIGLRGPGETQLETDRRLIAKRVKLIKQRLEKVRTQRAQNRGLRQKKPVPTVALVGYTNAGKSTLFNTLTESHVYAANQLFATLDPTLRRIELSELGEVVLADTVGFIRHLPHNLVDAFRATLEETRAADLLLHVIDMSHPERDDTIVQVEKVLEEIDASEIPCLKVYNKIDLLENFPPRIDYDADQKPQAVYVSAQAGTGLEKLKHAIVEYLTQDYQLIELNLMPSEAKLRAQLYAMKAIVEEKSDEDGNWQITARLSHAEYLKLMDKL